MGWEFIEEKFNILIVYILFNMNIFQQKYKFLTKFAPLKNDFQGEGGAGYWGDSAAAAHHPHMANHKDWAWFWK